MNIIALSGFLSQFEISKQLHIQNLSVALVCEECTVMSDKLTLGYATASFKVLAGKGIISRRQSARSVYRLLYLAPLPSALLTD